MAKQKARAVEKQLHRAEKHARTNEKIAIIRKEALKKTYDHLDLLFQMSLV